MKRIINLSLCIAVGLASLSILSCSSDSETAKNNDIEGRGGSMARFTISGNYIYTVDNHSLKVTRISDPAQPVHVNTYHLSSFRGDIETIFPYEGKLFIGSRSAMYIYDITTDPECPQILSMTSHFNSCDPVVPYGSYAYVTLSSGNDTCFRGVNELQVYDVTDPKNPQWRRSFDYGSIEPSGLDVDGEAGKLFVCTDQGVKVYDLGDDYTEIRLVAEISDIAESGAIKAYDVIATDGLLIVTGESGLFQYDYTRDPIKFLSSFDLR